MKLRYICSMAVVAAMSAQTLAHAYAGARIAGEEAARAISQARAAIGGETALSQVKSISFTGTSRTQTPQGEKSGDIRFVFATAHEGENGDVMMFHKRLPAPDGGERDVVVLRDGAEGGAPPADGKKRIVKIEATGGPLMAHGPVGAGPEFFHMVFSPMFAKNATHAGEETVEGVRYEVLALGPTRLYLDANTHLPAMVKSKGMPNVMVLAGPPAAPGMSDERVIVRELVDLKAPEGAENAEVLVRFSDYRAAGDLVLPYRITRTVNGQPSSDIEVREYQFNVPLEHQKLRHP